MQMAWILAIIGTITEVMMVHKIRYVDKLYTRGSNFMWISRWHIDGVVWNAIGSFALSYIQGVMFGATGLVIAVGGALGTGLSMIYFEAEKWIQKTYEQPTILEWVKSSIPQWKAHAAKSLQLARDVWKVIIFLLRVITFPIWGTRAAINWYNRTKAHFITT